MTFQEWLDGKGLNASAFAAQHPFISRSQVDRIRHGLCRPKLATARKLEEVTKIPAAKFVMGEAAERGA